MIINSTRISGMSPKYCLTHRMAGNGSPPPNYTSYKAGTGHVVPADTSDMEWFIKGIHASGGGGWKTSTENSYVNNDGSQWDFYYKGGEGNFKAEYSVSIKIATLIEFGDDITSDQILDEDGNFISA